MALFQLKASVLDALRQSPDEPVLQDEGIAEPHRIWLHVVGNLSFRCCCYWTE